MLLLLLLRASACAEDQQCVIVVVGAGGQPEYGQQFLAWASKWEEASRQTKAKFICLGREAASQVGDKELLREALKDASSVTAEPLWLVLLGHGTYDGHQAKFNLRGPDVSAVELAEWLKPMQRPLAVINCASSSAPFLNALSGKNRVVVTAAKSGFEQNFARFGEYFAAAIQDDKVDLDKDHQTSLLEAFLAASSRVEEYYAQEARLATEHALLEDNGDGLGTPADWFRGVRAVRTAKDGALPDGLLASQLCLIRSTDEQNMPSEQRARRDALEMELARLRQERQRHSEDEYYSRLESILVQLARLYEPIKSGNKPDAK